MQVPFYTCCQMMRLLGTKRQHVMLVEQPRNRGKNGESRGWSDTSPGYRYEYCWRIPQYTDYTLAHYAPVSHPKRGDTMLVQLPEDSKLKPVWKRGWDDEIPGFPLARGNIIVFFPMMPLPVYLHCALGKTVAAERWMWWHAMTYSFNRWGMRAKYPRSAQGIPA